MEYVAPTLDQILNYSRVCKSFKNVLCRAPFHFQCDIYDYNKQSYTPVELEEFWTHVISNCEAKPQLKNIIINYMKGFRKFQMMIQSKKLSNTLLKIMELFELMPNSFDHMEFWMANSSHLSPEGREFIQNFVNYNHNSLKYIKKLQHIPTPTNELQNLRKIELALGRRHCNQIIERLPKFIKCVNILLLRIFRPFASVLTLSVCMDSTRI